jgi:photosystem II PsbZ protein
LAEKVQRGSISGRLLTKTVFQGDRNPGIENIPLVFYLLQCWEKKMFSILFQIALTALVVLSFVMVIGVPVAYATPQNWEQSKRLIFIGSGVWVALVLLVGGLNYLVV